ncbi:VTT domain-containing protein [Patescibacteria group bacterium]|nr:VTT domain-containing protein [Patescibacteria group bacterium]
MTKFKEIIGLLILPIIVLSTYLVVYVIWRLLGLPVDESVANMILEKFSELGLWVVFLGAFLEGFFIVGQYFPGGVIIFLGVISSGQDILKVVTMVLIVMLAFVASYSVSYLLGKYGWYKLFMKFGFSKAIELAKQKLVSKESTAVLFTYWNPNLAAMTATAAGILQIPWRRFAAYSLAGIVFWETFWGILVFKLGPSALKIMGLKWVLIICVAWVLIILLKHYLFDKEKAG